MRTSKMMSPAARMSCAVVMLVVLHGCSGQQPLKPEFPEGFIIEGRAAELYGEEGDLARLDCSALNCTSGCATASRLAHSEKGKYFHRMWCKEAANCGCPVCGVVVCAEVCAEGQVGEQEQKKSIWSSFLSRIPFISKWFGADDVEENVGENVGENVEENVGEAPGGEGLIEMVGDSDGHSQYDNDASATTYGLFDPTEGTPVAAAKRRARSVVRRHSPNDHFDNTGGSVSRERRLIFKPKICEEVPVANECIAACKDMRLLRRRAC